MLEEWCEALTTLAHPQAMERPFLRGGNAASMAPLTAQHGVEASSERQRNSTAEGMRCALAGADTEAQNAPGATESQPTRSEHDDAQPRTSMANLAKHAPSVIVPTSMALLPALRDGVASPVVHNIRNVGGSDFGSLTGSTTVGGTVVVSRGSGSGSTDSSPRGSSGDAGTGESGGSASGSHPRTTSRGTSGDDNSGRKATSTPEEAANNAGGGGTRPSPTDGLWPGVASNSLATTATTSPAHSSGTAKVPPAVPSVCISRPLVDMLQRPGLSRQQTASLDGAPALSISGVSRCSDNSSSDRSFELRGGASAAHLRGDKRYHKKRRKSRSKKSHHKKGKKSRKRSRNSTSATRRSASDQPLASTAMRIDCNEPNTSGSQPDAASNEKAAQALCIGCSKPKPLHYSVPRELLAPTSHLASNVCCRQCWLFLRRHFQLDPVQPHARCLTTPRPKCLAHIRAIKLPPGVVFAEGVLPPTTGGGTLPPPGSVASGSVAADRDRSFSTTSGGVALSAAPGSVGGGSVGQPDTPAAAMASTPTLQAYAPPFAMAAAQNPALAASALTGVGMNPQLAALAAAMNGNGVTNGGFAPRAQMDFATLQRTIQQAQARQLFGNYAALLQAQAQAQAQVQAQAQAQATLRAQQQFAAAAAAMGARFGQTTSTNGVAKSGGNNDMERQAALTILSLENSTAGAAAAAAAGQAQQAHLQQELQRQLQARLQHQQHQQLQLQQLQFTSHGMVPPPVPASSSTATPAGNGAGSPDQPHAVKRRRVGAAPHMTSVTSQVPAAANASVGRSRAESDASASQGVPLLLKAVSHLGASLTSCWSTGPHIRSRQCIATFCRKPARNSVPARTLTFQGHVLAGPVCPGTATMSGFALCPGPAPDVCCCPCFCSPPPNAEAPLPDRLEGATQQVPVRILRREM